MPTPTESKLSVVKELTEGRNRSGVQCLGHSLRGQYLWSLFEITDERTGEKWKTINLDKLSLSGYYWSHRSYSIDSGPYYFNCPKKFIKALTESDLEKHTDIGKAWVKEALDNMK